MRPEGRKAYESADCDTGYDGGDGAGADVAGDAAAGGEGAEDVGDGVERLEEWVSWVGGGCTAFECGRMTYHCGIGSVWLVYCCRRFEEGQGSGELCSKGWNVAR